MNSVCLQRGRAIAPADAQRHQHPAEVDADHDRESKQRIPLRVHRSRRQPGQVRNGPPADEDGGDDEDRGLGQRRQMLRLPVTIGVAGIGGAPRDADREEREERRDEVDAGVRRLREQTEAVGRDACGDLERDQRAGCKHGDERGAALRTHT